MGSSIDYPVGRERVAAGFKRIGSAQPGQRHWGIVFLYSLETAELLAIIHDFTISSMRVGATEGLAVKHLARNGAVTLGILGSGKLARTQLEAISLVRPIERVNVYSPSEERRRDYCAEMAETLGLDIRPKEDVRSVVEEADIVCCASNSMEPIFSGEWLNPGQLVTSTVTADVVRPSRSEVDEATFVRSDVVVINDRVSIYDNKQAPLLEPIEQGLFTWDKVRHLGDILNGEAPGRSTAQELIFYYNNTGMAIQFAAACGAVYQEARRRGIGQEAPSEWFSTDVSAWYAKGIV